MVDDKDLPDNLKKSATSLAPEVVEILKIEGEAHININVLLEQAARKTEDLNTMRLYFESMIELSRQYEEHRLDAFRARTQALIDAKERDPDEIEKRLNNRTRRWLKGVIGTCAIFGIAGTLASVAIGSGIVVTGLLAAVGVATIVMSGPLASGESISSGDVVRMVRAIGNVIEKTSPLRGERNRQSNQRRE